MRKTVRAAFDGRHAVRLFSAVIFALLLLCSSSRTALAASPSSIHPEAAGSIRLTIQDADGAEAATDGEAAVYLVAGLAENRSSWVFSDAFADCGETIEDPGSAGLAKFLADYAEEKEITVTAVTAVENGEAVFTELPVGLYLVVQTEASSGFSPFSPFLVTLPQDGGEEWIYDIDASPKTQTERIPEEDTEPRGESAIAGEDLEQDADEENEEKEEETEGDEEPTAVSGSLGGSGSGISSGSSGSLPQTGQLNWPIPVLAVCGLFLIGLGSVFLYAGKPYGWDRTV